MDATTSSRRAGAYGYPGIDPHEYEATRPLDGNSGTAWECRYCGYGPGAHQRPPAGRLRQILIDGKPTQVYMDDVNLYGGGGLLTDEGRQLAERPAMVSVSDRES